MLHKKHVMCYQIQIWPILVAARSKAWVCGCLLVGIVVSNPVRGHGCLSLTNAACCQKSVCRTDHASREFLPTVVSLSVIINPRQLGGLGPLGAVGPC